MRRFENCEAMPMETLRIRLQKSSLQHVSSHYFQLMQMLRSHSFLMLRQCRLIVTLPFFGEAFEIIEPSVYCHLLLLWK